MCGIFCAFSRHGHVLPNDSTKRLLENRGPDCTGLHQIEIDTRASHVHATFLSTVLALRGSTVIAQPLVDDASGSVLCWNGEAWSIRGELVSGNDSRVIFDKLLDTCSSTAQSDAAVVELLSAVRGPYALVFYDAPNKRIYYGRDCLGRRSLLSKVEPDGSLLLSSVCDNASGDAWSEVEADGLYILDLQTVSSANAPFVPVLVPHRRSDEVGDSKLSFVGKSFRERVLLMRADITVPHHESYYPY